MVGCRPVGRTPRCSKFLVAAGHVRAGLWPEFLTLGAGVASCRWGGRLSFGLALPPRRGKSLAPRPRAGRISSSKVMPLHSPVSAYHMASGQTRVER